MNRILGNCTLRGTSKIQWGLKPYSTVRHFSSADGKSKEEMEEELYKLQRKSVLFYNKLNYKSALDFAIRGQDLTEKYMGKKNRIYASAVSNVALMHKSLGENLLAMDKYTNALHIYRSVGGQKSQQYSACLQNLGLLYKEMSSEAKSLDKEQLLERSEEALEESLNVRTELFGDSHRETLHAVVAYSTTLRLTNKLQEAEKLLKKAIRDTTYAHGDNDALLGRVHNALGLVYKHGEKYGEAKEQYEKAIAIQTEIFGDVHRDSVTFRHNLAEMFMAAGDRSSARDVQDHLMEVLNIDEDVEEPKDSEETAEDTTSSSSTDTNTVIKIEPTTSTESPTSNVEVTRTRGAPPVPAHQALAPVSSSGVDQAAVNAAIFEAVDNITGATKERKKEAARLAQEEKESKAPKRKVISGIDGFHRVDDNLSSFDFKTMMSLKMKEAEENPDRVYGTGTVDDPTDEELYGFDAPEDPDAPPENRRLSPAQFSSRKNLIMERGRRRAAIAKNQDDEDDDE